jgi:hypothetical protein
VNHGLLFACGWAGSALYDGLQKNDWSQMLTLIAVALLIGFAEYVGKTWNAAGGGR